MEEGELLIAQWFFLFSLIKKFFGGRGAEEDNTFPLRDTRLWS